MNIYCMTVIGSGDSIYVEADDMDEAFDKARDTGVYYDKGQRVEEE